MQEFYDLVLTGFSAVLGFLLHAVWQAWQPPVVEQPIEVTE